MSDAAPSPAPEAVMHEGKSVCIVLPWMKQTNPLTAFSVMALVKRDRTKVILRHGDSFVINSRNKLADDFLKSDCEWSLHIDDDMLVPFGNAGWFNHYSNFKLPEQFAGFNALDRLLSHGKTLVSATYWGRYLQAKPVFAEAMHDETVAAPLRKGPRDEIRPTRWVGFGCVLVHRSVFLDIEKHYPHLARGADGVGFRGFSPDSDDIQAAHKEALDVLSDLNIPLEARTVKAVQLLQAATKQNAGGSACGEDVSFCHRAAKAGHQPFVDLGLIAGHLGTHCFGPNNKK